MDAYEFHGTLTIVGVSAGSATITVTAQDSDGNRVSDTFDVTVTAPQPQALTPPEEEQPQQEPQQGQATSSGAPMVAAPLADMSLEGPEYREISLTGVFTDPNGDTFTFTAVSSNHDVASMWVDGSTLAVVGISTGTATITVTAEDADGNRVSDEFEVTVSPAS